MKLNPLDQIALVTKSFLHGFHYLLSPSLFRHYLRMLLYHAFSFIVYLVAVYFLGHYLFELISPSEWLTHHPIIDYFLRIVLYFNLLILFFTPYRYITIISLSPFLSHLGEKLYKEKMGKEPKVKNLSNAALMGRSFKLNIGLFFLEFGLNFILAFVRFFDMSFISYLLSFFIMSYFTGLSYMDFGLELYGKPAKETRDFVWDYKYMAVMIGLVYTSFLFFPILGFVLAPLFGLTLGVNSVVNVLENIYKKILPKNR